MSILQSRLSGLGLRARAAIAMALIVGAGVAASIVAGAPVPAKSPPGLAGLVDADDGRVVVDREGKPVIGPDGRPLRADRDRRTLLDSRGRPLRDARGRPLRLLPGNVLPADAERAKPRGRSRRGRGSRPRRRPPRGASAPATAGPPIAIGVAHLDADSHNGLGGQSGVTTRVPDPAIGIRALERWVNSTGGILGRPVKLDLYEYDYAGGRPLATVAQEICEHFKRTRPLAVVDRFGNPHLTLPCLAKAGIPLVADWPFVGPVSMFGRFADHYFAPGGLAADRIPDLYVGGLRRGGFFARGERVGLVRYRHPVLDEAGAAAKRALREAGVDLAAEAVIDPGDRVGVAGVLAQFQRAAVHFRSAGVTRVVAVTDHTIGFFMRSALAQGYFPRYGLSSMHSPNFIAIEGAGRDGDVLLEGAAAVGWAPLVDVPADGEPENRTRERCNEAFRQAGADIGNRTPYAQYAAYGYCDALLVVRTALERAGSVSVAGLRTGLEGLGASYQSPVTLRTRLDSAHHDGAAESWLMRYRAGCGCFRYGD